MKAPKVYTISPSELSYRCDHCAHLKHNYELQNKGVSAGITGELDSIQKKYFLGDCKKIDMNLPDGEVIDPDHKNESFFSKVLYDNKKRPFRLKGKGDALIAFKDKTSGIIDYKTSKFKDKKGADYSVDLLKKIKEYTPQLHGYDLLYSNLETDKKFLTDNDRGTKQGWKKETIDRRVKEKLEKIEEIKVKKTALLGLVFVYPEDFSDDNKLNIHFSYQFKKVDFKPKKFLEELTNYFDSLHSNEIPPIPEKCKDTTNRTHCWMHNYFFDEKKLQRKNG